MLDGGRSGGHGYSAGGPTRFMAVAPSIAASPRPACQSARRRSSAAVAHEFGRVVEQRSELRSPPSILAAARPDRMSSGVGGSQAGGTPVAHERARRRSSGGRGDRARAQWSRRGARVPDPCSAPFGLRSRLTGQGRRLGAHRARYEPQAASLPTGALRAPGAASRPVRCHGRASASSSGRCAAAGECSRPRSNGHQPRRARRRTAPAADVNSREETSDIGRERLLTIAQQ